MPGSAPFRLNRSGMLLALISAAFAGEAAAAAGRVDFTTPGVTVAGRDGQARPLAKGTELDNGDTVRTSNEGRAQIRFSDGSYVSLQPNTDFAINEYKFEGKDDDRGFFGLVKGAMRTVTGAVGRVNRNSYRITTPTATVGIRGTGGVVQVLNNGSTLVIGTSGIWSLTNPAGSIDIPAGVSGLAPTDPNTPPKETTTQPQTSPPTVEPKKDDFVQGNQVNPDGTADLGTPKVLISGPGYGASLAYTTTFFGPQLRGGDGDGGEGGGGGGLPALTGDAVFNPSGQLTQVAIGGTTYQLAPGGTHAEFGTDGILAWGRWVGPVNISPSQCEGPCVYTENTGFHYVIGTPTPVMPIGGSATYSLLGATSPTWTDGGGAPGKFTGSLAVDFRINSTGSHNITGDFNVAMPDGKGYGWRGTATSPSNAFTMQTNGFSGTGGACSGGCDATVLGFFAGASAQRAGISYHVRDGQLERDLIGAAAFKRN